LAKRITWARCGSDHIQINYGEKPGDRAFRAACAVRQILQAEPHDVACDYIIAPDTALVRFKLRPERKLREWADGLISAMRRAAGSRRSRQHRKRVPVRYNGRDLKAAAALAELSPDDFIQTHEKATYSVYAMGGSPGLAYLSGLDAKLHLDPPAKLLSKAKAGSVVIAGSDCFLVSTEQAGAWYVIAETIGEPFDPERDPPFLLQPCDQVRFIATAEVEEGQDAGEESGQ